MTKSAAYAEGMTPVTPVLKVAGLCVDIGATRVVDDVSLTVGRGRIVGLVGPSGAGKSTVLAAAAGLLPTAAHVAAGEVLLYGRQPDDSAVDLLGASASQLAQVCGRRLATIFQNPGSFLDPTMRVGAQVSEVLRCHARLSADQARERALSLFRRVELPNPESLLSAYPFELSGGMQQRVSIALAMAAGPEILLADEPTSALDPTTQVAIVDELRCLRDGEGTSILLVTHDIGLAYRLCDDLYVMEGGHVVESGKAACVVEHPAAAMTKQLIAAVPRIMEGE